MLTFFLATTLRLVITAIKIHLLISSLENPEFTHNNRHTMCIASPRRIFSSITLVTKRHRQVTKKLPVGLKLFISEAHRYPHSNSFVSRLLSVGELQALLCRLHSHGSDIERVEILMENNGDLCLCFSNESLLFSTIPFRICSVKPSKSILFILRCIAFYYTLLSNITLYPVGLN